MQATRVLKKFAVCLIAGLFILPSQAAGIPEGYYDSANGKADSLLKASLYEICRGGKRVAYGTQGYTYQENIYYPGSWNYFPLTDKRADGTIWDMYSDTKRYYPYDGGSAGGIQIEHCIPKSWWGWTKSDTASSKRAYQDLFILNPSDAQANGQKSNYPPGHVQKGDKFDNGSFRMDKAASSPYPWICFEPAEEYRGDFARTYFYAVTAYQDLPWGAGNKDYERYVSDDHYLIFQDILTEVLLDWHRADPVSRKETERANAIYDVQENRNPYIDYPELVEYIWGDKRGERVQLSRLECTAQDTYTPQEDYTNFAAYAPTDRTEEGFTARWLDFHTTYTLDVYTKHVTGKNDTLINMPSVTPKRIDTTLTAGQIGRLGNAGTTGVVLGVGDTDGGIVLRPSGLKKSAVLHFRANMYQTASSGEIRIFLDNHPTADSIILLPESRDEQFYHVTIPAGTDSIRLISYGGKTTKRACLHELYLIQGDLQTEQLSISGYPAEIDHATERHGIFEYYVALPKELRGESVYYRVSSTTGEVSNEAEASKEPLQEGLPTITRQKEKGTEKVMQGGQVTIKHRTGNYSILGQKK